MLYRSEPAYFTFLLVDASGAMPLPTMQVTPVITRAIDGGTATPGTGTTTRLAAGWYRYDLSPTETDCDRASFLIEAPRALPQTRDIAFARRDAFGVPCGHALPGFVFSLVSRDGINPPEPGQPIATVSSDGTASRQTTNLPVWVGGERYRIDLTPADLAGRCNHFVITMPGAIPARFAVFTVA